VTDQNSSRAIKEFLGEAEEIIEKLNLDLVALGDDVESGDVDPDCLNSVFRGAHSLKGLSGMFGFDDISELAHHAENLLDTLRLGKIQFGNDLLEVLFDVLELLTRLVNGKGKSETFTLDIQPAISRIDAILHKDESSANNSLSGYGIDPSILSVLTEYEEHRLLENIKKKRTLLRVTATFSLTSFDQELAEITELIKKSGEVISTLPSPGDITDKISFQLLVGTSETLDGLGTVLQGENVDIELLSSSPVISSETKVDDTPQTSAAVSDSSEGDSASLRSISRTVRVDIDKLDVLMNIVGELVLSKAAISSVADNLKATGNREVASDLQKATRTLERRLNDLQKGVMEVRMVPVGQLFDKMTRIVRRVAGEHGKKISLDIHGADTELDKLIVEDLSDPLMHIIRNAIDHGIESSEDRLALGKPEKGTISLWASQKGNHVVVEIKDDGKGIDPEKVRRKAVQKGLVSATAELSKEDVLDLIFMPGFSTSDEVSDLSGRGVGMDVVRNNISALSGMIEINSEVGEGTSMLITLPITLAIIKALIVRVCDKTYAIPINSVMETFMLDASAVRTIEKREVIELRQSTLPLLRLSELFALETEANIASRFFVTVVGLADKKIGIVVDELLGQQDVVIKSLGNTLSFVKGIAGAADLGNQKTILVLDVGGLMSESLKGETGLYV